MFNSRIMKKSDAAPYSMPSLEDGGLLRTRDTIQKETEEIQRQAYEQGFKSGEKAGFSEGENKASTLITRLGNIISEVTEFKDVYILEVETNVVDLAVAIARKIINDEIRTRPEIIVSMVKEALKRLQRVGNIRIKINPALYDLFMKMKPELLEVHEDITFDVDSSVSVTGPFVISDIEEVVTDIDSMINNIVNDMKSADAAGNEGHEESPENDIVE